jgi:hypothetical protein
MCLAVGCGKPGYDLYQDGAVPRRFTTGCLKEGWLTPADRHCDKSVHTWRVMFGRAPAPRSCSLAVPNKEPQGVVDAQAGAHVVGEGGPTTGDSNG